jgi:RNA polymerase sigma factor (sigma-70 family)
VSSKGTESRDRDELSAGFKRVSDHELIQRILAGHQVQDSWNTVLARYSNLIYTVPLRYGLQESDAADVYQGVCEALWKDLAHVRDHERLGSWLITVAGHLSWRLIMKRRQQTQRENPIGDDEIPLSDPGPQPEDLALRRDQWNTVNRAVCALPDRCRKLVWYLYFDPEAPSYEQIAERMEMALGSVGPIRKRCLEQLKKHLQGLDDYD